MFDQNGDGKISAEELKQVMKNLGEVLTEDEIDQVRYDGRKAIDDNRLISFNVNKNLKYLLSNLTRKLLLKRSYY